MKRMIFAVLISLGVLVVAFQNCAGPLGKSGLFEDGGEPRGSASGALDTSGNGGVAEGDCHYGCQSNYLEFQPCPGGGSVRSAMHVYQSAVKGEPAELKFSLTRNDCVNIEAVPIDPSEIEVLSDKSFRWMDRVFSFR